MFDYGVVMRETCEIVMFDYDVVMRKICEIVMFDNQTLQSHKFLS
jgi:hypothetical protein